MIKHILFDLAGVCMSGLIGVEPEIARHSGAKEDDVRRHLRGEKLDAIFRGEMSEDGYWDMFINEGGYPLHPDFLKRIVRGNFEEFPETISIIRKLKGKYPIALLSDHVREWIGYIEQNFDFMKLFDQRFYSFDLGYTKRNPLSFRCALKKWGANPAETFFVDDFKVNLVPAQAAGIKYVHKFVDAPSLENALPGMGISLNGR